MRFKGNRLYFGEKPYEQQVELEAIRKYTDNTIEQLKKLENDMRDRGLLADKPCHGTCCYEYRLMYENCQKNIMENFYKGLEMACKSQVK